MSSNVSTPSWLSEPMIIDETFAKRGEHTLDWLARSTVPRAREARVFLKKNIQKLPLLLQENIIKSARSRWESVFFEIIVARVLQELGAVIEVEKAIESGRRPDFTAQFTDGTVIVEAVSPVFNANTQEISKNRDPLLEFIEANTPSNWQIGISKLPSIGPTASKKEFKSAVLRLMERLRSSQLQGQIELEEVISTGTIRIIAMPAKNSKSGILWEAPLVTFDNSIERIKHAVTKKKVQIRNAPFPVLLAIQGSNAWTDLEDFDQALFGHTFERLDHNLRVVETGFKTDGLLTSKLDSEPKFAGVIAFLDTGFIEGPAPILYLDPRHKAVLPEGVLQLKQRRFNFQTREIEIKETTINNLMQKLEFVPRGI